MTKQNTKAPPLWCEIEASGRMLRPVEVSERIGLSLSQIYAMISDGCFPPFVKLSSRAVGLPESWLQQFVQSKVQASGLSNTTQYDEQAASKSFPQRNTGSLSNAV